MRQCPKCSKEYDDTLKICRVCGGILESEGGVPEEGTSPADDQLPCRPEPSSWICPQCKQSVPGSFEVCWSCGTSQDGTPDPDFLREPEEEKVERSPEDGFEQDRPARIETPIARPSYKCPRCGSTRVVPRARVVDQGEHSNGDLQVVVYGNPEALIFKDRLYGRLSADICGDCGYVELRVENPGELYQHYWQASQ